MSSTNKGEEEIKIEYIESFEVDPLCENAENDNDRANISFLSNFSNVVINQVSNFAIETFAVHESAVNDENDYPTMAENEETWFKSVDHLGRYLCKFCDLFYSTIQTVRHHVKTKHLEDYNQIKSHKLKNVRRCKFKCHVCKKTFKHTNDLQEHVQSHGINNIQKSCFLCRATFEKDTEMLIHMSNKHKSVRKKLHICFICGYSTSKGSHFKQHENTHTGYNHKKCSHCEYSTNHPPNLRTHERIHTNDKPYSCTFNSCHYRCSAKSALYSHQLQHEKTKNMIYCDKCSYSTVYKQSLKKHMDSHRRNSVRTRF